MFSDAGRRSTAAAPRRRTGPGGSVPRGARLPYPVAAVALLAALMLPASRPVSGFQATLPELTIDSVATETEGKRGVTRPYYFRVKLDKASNLPVTVSFGSASLEEQA